MTDPRPAGNSNLTRSQWLIWAGQRLEPELPLYNMVLSFTLDGALDRELFVGAWQRLVDASDTLRSVFEEHDGIPQRRVRPPFQSAPEFVDLSSQQAPEQALTDWIAERSKRPFRLGHCLFDCALVRLNVERHAWYINQHHLITDGWSTAVLYRALADFYREPDGQHELPAYDDYASFEAANRSSRAFVAAQKYWQDKVSDPLAATEFYGALPASPGAHIERVDRQLGAARSAALAALCQQRGVLFFNPEITLHIVFATLLFACLHRIGGPRTLRIGTPFHNRSTAQFKETLGLFMEVYPLQIETQADETFESLLKKVTREMQSTLVHAQPGVTSTASNKSYDVFLNLVNIDFGDFAGLPVKVNWLHSGSADASHSLRLQVHDFGATGELALQFDLNRSVFVQPQDTPITRHFLAMTDALLDDRSQIIADIELCDASETRRLQALESGPRVTDDTLDMIDRFRHHASVNGGAVAVRCGETQMSYAELDTRSDGLAAYLLDAGVGADTLVGVCLRRSPEAIVAILGVLKAGGAWVAIDPGYPAARVKQLLAELQRRDKASLLLTVEELAPRFSAHALRVLKLDTDRDRILGSSGKPAAVAVDADALAYMLFTSGSTGMPKGVMIPRRGLNHYLNWAARFYVDDQPTRMPLFSSLSFDLTLTSMFVPLVTGGCVVVYPERDERDALAILEVVDDDSVDMLKLTPSHLALLAGRDCRARGVRTLVLGGEDLKTVQARTALEIFGPQLVLYNEYGPTESTVGCMIHRFDPQNDRGTSVPIGRPIEGTEIYVLNARRRRQPPGVRGELHIASPALARGYLHRADETARVFVDNPFETSGRLYASGDLARWRDDGALEFLGRADEQIKLRGARIEPGDIEAALLAHEAVSDATVTLFVDGGSSVPAPTLVAYYAAAQPLLNGELRSTIAARLPETMIPARFVWLPALPVTANGKVDRNALPAPQRIVPDDEHREPRNDTERLLADVWTDVLGLEGVGIDDNFFELGGDSISNIRICAQARRAGLRVEPAQIFSHPSIAALAKVAVVEELPEAEQGAVTGAVPLTPIQQWFFEQSPGHPAHWNQAVMLDVPGDIEVACFEAAIGALRSHHDALRACFQQSEQDWEQRIAPPGEGSCALQVIDLAGLGPDVQQHTMASHEADLHRSLDLANGDLVRGALFRRGRGQSARLLLIIHHLAVDGVSWYVLLQDLERACRQWGNGQPLALPSKTTSFKSWAERLRRHARDAIPARERDWWRKQAAAAPRVPPGHYGEQSTECSVAARVSAERTRALLKRVPGAYNTRTDEVLLTALASVAPQWCGQPTLYVDLEGHGREELVDGVDLSRTVGWFTSIHPVNLQSESGAIPGAALQSVKEQLRAVPNNGIGFGLLRYLGDDAALASELGATRPPWLFNYLGRLDSLVERDSRFSMARELVLSQSDDCRRIYDIIVDAFVLNNELRVSFRYSAELHEQNHIRTLAAQFEQALNELIDHCLQPGAGRLTPSDFPEAGLSQSDLDDLVREFGE